MFANYAVIFDLYRADLFYADGGFRYWSLNGPDGTYDRKSYEKFSERFLRLYPGYMLDRNMRIVAKPETNVINLKALVSLLISKDAELWERCRWMFNNSHFYSLDGEPNITNKIAICSFPRSGNTFLRKFCELLTGIVTGSDSTCHNVVNLQLMGCRAENIVDDTVCMVKSHTPWVMAEGPRFNANKVFVVVRNPLDSIVSWLQMLSMNNHAIRSPFDFEKEYPNFFDAWIKDCASRINEWVMYTLNQAKFRNVPMLFIRFEDLVMNPEPELYNLMRFFLGTKDLKGTNAERRIKEVLAMDTRST